MRLGLHGVERYFARGSRVAITPRFVRRGSRAASTLDVPSIGHRLPSSDLLVTRSIDRRLVLRGAGRSVPGGGHASRTHTLRPAVRRLDVAALGGARETMLSNVIAGRYGYARRQRIKERSLMLLQTDQAILAHRRGEGLEDALERRPFKPPAGLRESPLGFESRDRQGRCPRKMPSASWHSEPISSLRRPGTSSTYRRGEAVHRRSNVLKGLTTRGNHIQHADRDCPTTLRSRMRRSRSRPLRMDWAVRTPLIT